MIDFILWTFWIATFAGGFWCGKKFQTVEAMFVAAKAKIKSWLA